MFVVSHSSKRSLQVAELICRNLSIILRQYVRMPELNCVIVSYVKVSNDLSKATIFFTLLDKTKLKVVKKLFAQETKRLRNCLAKKVKLRYIPELRFIYDSFAEDKERLLNLIHDLPDDEN